MERPVDISADWHCIHPYSVFSDTTNIWRSSGADRIAADGGFTLAYFLVAKCAVLYILITVLFSGIHGLLLWTGTKQAW